MDLKKCKWIQGSTSCEAPIFRRNFEVGSKPESAKMIICGLGFFELYINGKRVSEDLFVPAWTNYEPRKNCRHMLYPINDELSCRTYYLEYDVLAYLNMGKNAIAVVLGNGWYHQTLRTVEGDFSYGFPKLFFKLCLTDENSDITVIESDENVRWHESEIINNNLFFGEVHDLRQSIQGFSLSGFDDSGWKQVNLVSPPDTNFELQNCPADKEIRRIIPLLIYDDGVRRVFDCKENITGYSVIKTPADEGAEINIRYSEELNTVKELDFSSTGGEEQIQADKYICSSEECVCHPRFCWHGFRYFEVIGSAQVLNVSVVHADIEVTSGFECSNETLNWIYSSYIRSQLTNIHCGVPSDCPHRERLGYTGDGQITANAAMMTLNARLLYEKWLKDIADCQDIKSGHVQHTAPFYGGGGGPGGWGGAVFLVPLAFYNNYGDIEVLKKYYRNILQWVDYMESRTQEGLVVREEEGGWCLGDWNSPEKLQIPEPFVNTYYYIRALRAVKEISLLLNNNENIELINQRLTRCENAMTDKYFDPKTHSFCGGVNGADAFAVSIGLGDCLTLYALVNKYKKSTSLDTGIFGTDILIDVLFRNGYQDLAFELLIRHNKGCSFEDMRQNGATTLWECWSGEGSHNHPMFGGVVRSLFTYILGIKQAENSVGYSEIRIEPANISGLDWAKGYIQTPQGRISVSYEKDKNGNMLVTSSI